MVRSAFFRSSTVIAVAFALYGSTAANAGDFCELRLLNICQSQTPSECYESASPTSDGNNGSCDESFDYVVTKADLNADPANPKMSCVASGNGNYDCEAWPQGDRLSYNWYGDDNSAIVTEVITPFRRFTCGAGVVSVAIIGPGGGSSIATATIPACH